jgi:hypothetical protein
MSAARSRPGGLFRGSELPRLLILAAVMIAGWALLFGPFRSRPKPVPPSPPVVVEALTPLPPPDPAPEFQGLQDRYPMTARDNAAYATLLDRVRGLSPSELAAMARRDVRFSQVLENPDRYRGLPIHVEGTVRRVLRQDVAGSKLFRSGVYYEAYLFTADSVNFPWFLVFEEPTKGQPIGDEMFWDVTFDGFFLKLLAYHAADTARFAPVLVGRIANRAVGGPSAAPVVGGGGSGLNLRWIALFILVLAVYLVLRAALVLRRRPTWRPSRGTAGVADTIEPEELSAWLEEKKMDETPPPPGSIDAN